MFVIHLFSLSPFHPILIGNLWLFHFLFSVFYDDVGHNDDGICQIKLTIFNIYSDGTAYVRIKIPACEGEIHLAHTFMYELCLHCRLHSECKMKNSNKNMFFGLKILELKMIFISCSLLSNSFHNKVRRILFVTRSYENPVCY